MIWGYPHGRKRSNTFKIFRLFSLLCCHVAVLTTSTSWLAIPINQHVSPSLSQVLMVKSIVLAWSSPNDPSLPIPPSREVTTRAPGRSNSRPWRSHGEKPRGSCWDPPKMLGFFWRGNVLRQWFWVVNTSILPACWVTTLNLLRRNGCKLQMPWSSWRADHCAVWYFVSSMGPDVALIPDGIFLDEEYISRFTCMA